ncbi:MAG: tetratricopeptide repeat protein [Armatimonadota bacterium]
MQIRTPTSRPVTLPWRRAAQAERGHGSRRRLIALSCCLLAATAVLVAARPWTRYSDEVPPRFLVPSLVELSQGAPKSAAAHLRTAEALAEHGHHLSALEHFEAAREMGVRTPAALRLHAQSLMVLGREEEAEGLYGELVQAQPADLDALLRLTVTQVQLSKREAARTTLERLIAAAPEGSRERPAVLREAVQAYFTLGDVKRSLALAREYSTTAPDDPGGHVAVAKSARGTGDLKAAIAALEQARELAPRDGTVLMLLAQARYARDGYRYTPQVVAGLQKAVELDPYLGQAHYYLGEYYATRKMWAHSAGEFLKAHDLGAEPVRALRGVAESCRLAGKKLEGFFRMGQYYEAQSLTDQALEQYSRIWKTQSCCASGFAHHSDALRRARKIPEALQIVERGLKSVPGDISLTRRKSELFILLGRLDEAKPLLQDLLERDEKTRAGTFQDLAAIAAVQASYDEAEEYYLRSLAEEPSSTDTRIRLGKLYLQRRTLGDRLKRAEAQFQWLVENAPTMDEPHGLLAEVYSYQGRLNEASQLVRHAIDLAPGRGAYYLQLGQLCQKSGDPERAAWALAEYRKFQGFERAIGDFNRRIRANPNDGKLRLEFGQFLLHAGDYQAAARELQVAGAQQPKSREVRAALATAYDGLGRSADAAEQRLLASQ